VHDAPNLVPRSSIAVSHLIKSISVLLGFFVAPVIASAVGSASAAAEGGLGAASDPHWASSLQYENDMLFSDYYYTDGVKLSWVSPSLSEWKETETVRGFLCRMADRINFDKDDSNVRHHVAINIGQNIYTPVDSWRKTPQPDDRPYCGWLYLGGALSVSTDRWMNIIELQVGVTGDWSLARQLQQSVHTYTNEYPQWVDQIGNEVQVNLALERRYRLLKFGGWCGQSADLIASYGGCLGTLYQYERAGLTARYGWNLPGDFGPSPIRPAGGMDAPESALDPRLRDASRWSVSLFASYEGKAVQRDGTLEGNYSRESPRVGKMPFVQDASFGVNTVVGHWNFALLQVFRSPEFKNQRNGWHSFNSVAVSYTY